MSDFDEDWYLLDRAGRSYGPYGRDLVERLVAQREVLADTPVWHPGLADWRSAGEILAFKADTRAPSATIQAPPAPSPPTRSKVSPPAVPRAPVAKRVVAAVDPQRLWQRAIGAAFDLLLVAVLLRAVAFALPTVVPPWITSRVAVLVAWALLDGWLIAHFANTPGKALLGVTVRARGGNRLNERQALLRSAAVPVALILLTGLGSPFGFIAVLVIGFSLYRLRAGQGPWWDGLAAAEVTYVDVSPARRVLIAIAFTLAMLALGWLRGGVVWRV